MSAELQFRSAVLADMMATSIGRQLRTACPPRFGGFSVDHLEVVPGAASVRQGQAMVEVLVPTDVFIVTDDALLAAPNGVPAGALTPAGRIVLIVGLRMTLTAGKGSDGKTANRYVLDFVPQDPDLGALNNVPGVNPDVVRAGIRASLPTSSVELTGVLKGVGITDLNTADVVLTGDVVAVRIGPTEQSTDRLGGGQQWGLFLDATSVEALVRSKVEPSITKKFPGAEVSVGYAPAGDVPHVDLAISMTLTISDFDFEVRGVIDLPLDFSVTAGPAPALRETVNWSVHVYADLVPGFIESIAEDFLEDFVDPASFGGTVTGDHTFVIDTPLPAMTLPGARLRYDTALATTGGMTIGGAVVASTLVEPPLAIKASRLGGPTRVQRCSQLAKSGSGARSPEPPTLANTTSYGQLEITGCGAICDVELRTPGGWYRQFVSAPAPGPTDNVTVGVTIPYSVANSMTEPMTFVIRTPRGVRFVDLGTPPKATVDAAGRIVGALDLYVPDCLTVVVDGSGRAGAGWGGDVSVFVPPPLEHPDWGTYLQQGGGVVVQLVEVADLASGELVRFRSATHSIDVVADQAGVATVPVLLPLMSAPGPALLQRAGGGPLGGRLAVRSVAFEQRLTLPGRAAAQPVATRSGRASLFTRSAGRTLLHTLTDLGAISTPAAYEASELNPQPLPPVEVEVELNPQPLPPVEVEVELNPQPLPPVEVEVELNPQPLPPVEVEVEVELNPQPLPPVERQRLREAAARRVVRGLAQLVPIPGFPDHPLAVAVLRDGSALLLDESAGTVRIAGTFSGPIGALHPVGDWAIVHGRHDTAVLRRTIGDWREHDRPDTG